MRSRASSLPLACWRSTERAEPAWYASSRRFCRSSSFSCMLLPVIGPRRYFRRRATAPCAPTAFSAAEHAGRAANGVRIRRGRRARRPRAPRRARGGRRRAARRSGRRGSSWAMRIPLRTGISGSSVPWTTVVGTVEPPQAVGAGPRGDGPGLVEHGEARRRAAGDGGGHLVDPLGVRGGEPGRGDAWPTRRAGSAAAARPSAASASSDAVTRGRRRRVLRARRAGAEQHEPPDAVGPAHRQLLGDHPAHRQPDDGRPRRGRGRR